MRATSKSSFQGSWLGTYFGRSPKHSLTIPAPKYIPYYSVSDYQRWEGNWELWNGIAVAMTPSPFGRHQWVAGQLLTQLNVQLQAASCRDCYVVSETDWIVSSDTVVRPDVAVICGQFPERFIETTPELIIEVTSESTADKDRTAKYELYERQGVKNYLIVDPKDGSIVAYKLIDDHYQLLACQPELNLNLHSNCQIILKPLPTRNSQFFSN